MVPRSGAMREQLVIQTATRATDSHGATPASAWSTLDTVSAEYIPIRAEERLQAQAITTRVISRFRVHSRSDLTTRMRALWRPSWLPSATPKTLEIHSVLPDPEALTSHLLLECGEAPAA